MHILHLIERSLVALEWQTDRPTRKSGPCSRPVLISECSGTLQIQPTELWMSIRDGLSCIWQTAARLLQALGDGSENCHSVWTDQYCHSLLKLASHPSWQSVACHTQEKGEFCSVVHHFEVWIQPIRSMGSPQTLVLEPLRPPCKNMGITCTIIAFFLPLTMLFDVLYLFSFLQTIVSNLCHWTTDYKDYFSESVS